jgi:hypothetical protein
MPDVPKTVIERMRAAVPGANHPDADLLTAFAEQSLPVPERTTVLQHLARCSECREVVALALPPTEAVTAAATSPARSGWLTWPALRWGLVAAGVVIIASLGILRSRRIAAPSIAAYKGPEITIPEQRAQSSAPASTLPAAPPAGSSDKSEKLLAGADSPSSTTAVGVEPKVVGPKMVEPNVVEPKTTARAVGSATTRSGYGARTAVGGVPLLQQGPKMPAQWQQSNNNNLQLQSSNNSPQPGQSVGSAAGRQIPLASPMTVEASGETPQAQTQQEAQLRDQSAQSPATSSHGSLLKAKPAEPASVTLMSAGPGQIGGYVVDPFGAAVSNARITITPSGTRESVTATTNAQGAWLIAGLPTGNYKAQAEAPGFKTTVADLSYDASRPSTYSFTLNLGSVSETVAVSAQDVQVSTDTANIVSTGANREVSQAPLNGRSVTELTSLSPGLRWTITAAGALQRSLDQGHTWQTVDVSAAAAASLELAAQQPASSQSLAQQKSANRKVSKKEASAPNFRAVAAAGAEVWAGGSSGTLYHSIDAGNDWVRVQPSSNGSILTGDIVSLDFPDSQHGKITTSTPEVWTTSDAGQTWQKQ